MALRARKMRVAADTGYWSPLLLSHYRDNSCQGRSGDHEEEKESFQEVDLAASSTSRTIVDLRVALYKTSSSGSSLRGEYFLSTIASDGATAIGGSSGMGTDNVIGCHEVSLDTSQSLEQMHHVTEVVTVDVEVPSVVSAPSTGHESIQATAVNMGDVVVRKKCTRWICPYDKSRFGVAVFVLCYVVIGVIFLPFTLVILMICCISYFTPGIDDWCQWHSREQTGISSLFLLAILVALSFPERELNPCHTPGYYSGVITTTPLERGR